MRSAQRLKTLLLMELLLGVARTLSQKIAVKENLRAETISVAMRLIAATLGSINLHEEFGFRFIFADTVIGADSKYIAAFKNLTPLLVRLLGSIVEDSTDSSNRLERAVLLTQLYEQTIDFDIEQVGGEIMLVDPERGKKRMGQFYTPLALSRRTVSIAFNQLFADKKYDSIEKIKSLKILDPAMGGGVFILSALEYLTHHCEKIGIEVSKLSLADCLYGVDLDPLACEVAPLALWLYCVPGTNLQPKTMASFGANFKHADALLSGWSFLNTSSTGNGGKIFLWDKEFPQIFPRLSQGVLDFPPPENGFDAIISNPPWELAKPNSQEFFTRTSPDFRKLTKQDAVIQSQKLLAEQNPIRRRWQKEQKDYQDKAEHIRKQIVDQSAIAAAAADIAINAETAAEVAAEVAADVAAEGPADVAANERSPRHLFASQGESDLNIYKLFLDLGFALLKNDGSMAMIVPSGVLADKGAFPLRRMFLTKGRLHSVETFVNSDRAFPIHPSFAYSVIGVQKDGETRTIRVKFDQQSNLQFSYQQKDISILSPRWLTIFDVSHPKDLEILKKLHTNGVPLGGATGSADSDWKLKFKREYDMTNDSHLFRTVSDAEQEGFRCDIFGNWLKGSWRKERDNNGQGIENKVRPDPIPSVVPSEDYQFSIKIEQIEEVLLPLYEGRMIGQFDYSQKCHLSGSGRTAIWQPNHEMYTRGSMQPKNLSTANTEQNSQTDSTIDRFELLSLLSEQSKPIRSHYLVRPNAKASSPLEPQLKTGYLAVGSATNVRTMLASALFMMPCGNSVPVFNSEQGLSSTLGLTACLNSFVFDYALRMRMTGNNLNYFLLQECPLPHPEVVSSVPEIVALAAAINLNHFRNSAQWLELSDKHEEVRYQLFAISKLERLHVRSMLDALIAEAFKLSYDEYAWMLRGCDRQASRDKKQSVPAYAKGFWRDGKGSQPSMRLPVLALAAYRTLLDEGRENFLKKTIHFQHARLDQDGRKDLNILDRNLQEILRHHIS